MSASSKARRRSSRKSFNPLVNGLETVPERLPRTTPRNSVLAQNIRNEAEETPYTNLRQLAGLINRPTTPSGRPSSIGPSSTKRSVRQNSADRDRTPADGAQRQTPSRRGLPTTPHALRALQQRRAGALTPGRNRRRSGRVQRETPRDALRNLSRILARDSKPSDPSPLNPPTTKSQTRINNEPDLEDGLDPPRPRLSLPIDEEDEEGDSFEMPAPRLSAPPEDDNNTQRSVEVARRALSEQTGNRYSRGSFGSVRTSDRFSDFNELGLGIGPEEADATLGQDFGDFDAGAEESEDDFEISNNSATQGLQQAFFEEANRPLIEADELPDLDEPEESMFEFDVPAQTEDIESSLVAPEPMTVMDSISQTIERPKIIAKKAISQSRKPIEARYSKHGILCPSISAGVVKKVASTFLRSSGKGKTQMNRDTLNTIMQSTDWFFEQVSEDLASYATHAGRKTIDESDVITLMKRQRQLNASTTTFSLAQRHLPRELIQELRMAPPLKKKGGKSRPLRDEDSDG